MSDDVLKCDLCKKSFSGVVPYSQHLKSMKHLKKKNQIELEATIKLPVTEEGKLYCTLCSMKFSGVIPFQQHMNGSTHMKNVRRQDVMKDICHNLNSNSNSNPKQTGFRTLKDKKKTDDGYFSYNSGSSVSGMSISSRSSSGSGSIYSGMNPSRLSTSNSYNPLNISEPSQNLDPGIELQKTLYEFKSYDEQSSTFQKPKERFLSNSNLWDSGFHSSGLPSTSTMSIPQVESKVQGCEICEIFSFNSQEEFIIHLQSDAHFLQKLKKMALTSIK